MEKIGQKLSRSSARGSQRKSGPTRRSFWLAYRSSLMLKGQMWKKS